MCKAYNLKHEKNSSFSVIEDWWYSHSQYHDICLTETLKHLSLKCRAHLVLLHMHTHTPTFCWDISITLVLHCCHPDYRLICKSTKTETWTHNIGLQNHNHFKLTLIQGHPVTCYSIPRATSHLFTLNKRFQYVIYNALVPVLYE